ncbi:phosphorylcholine transferase LicD [uncultured Methanobrevibacter sp.]|uniref:LicD family protein n=1 Tax=uncultured Methanobrevibacter sp. TaxID=253161 RepID=UPI0025E12584|nr:LicD family protein [uncultured Methanobrevibacter sp.]
MAEYDKNTLKHVQDVQLMILKDFIKICEKNNLEYYAYGGTVIGTIRHGGFIPWDDDIDVLMLREDYEKFLKIMDEMQSEKYELLSIDKYEDYHYMFSKLSLKGTKFKNYWCLKKSFNVGINIDIFIFDYIPSDNFKFKIFKKRVKILKKIAYILEIIQNEYYNSTYKKIIIYCIKFIFRLLNINNKTYKKLYKKLLNKLHDKSDKSHSLVYDLAAISYDEPLRIDTIKPPRKVKFESIEINIPNNYDNYLKINFGNYMEIPPKDKQTNHCPLEIDFGKY